MLRKLILLASLLLLPSIASAQYFRYDGFVLSNRGPLGGQSIAVCAQPAVTTTQPCSPLVPLFSAPSGGTLVNPTTSDSFGNFHFYVAPGIYTVQIYGPQVYTPYILPDQIIPGSGTVTSNLNGIIIIDNVVNTLPSAINNAPAGSTILVPPGTYNITSGITITQSNVHVICSGENSTKIVYTGAAITALVDVGTADNGSANQYNDTINGCTFSGSANTTYVMRTRGTHHSDFSHNSLINAVTSALYVDFAVVDIFDNIHTSSNEQAFTQQPVNCIIGTGPDGSHAFSDNVMKGNICEGVSGDGWQLGQASNTTIIQGTSEANARGLNITANATRTTIIGTDFESNSTEDLLDNGSVTNVTGALLASTVGCHVGATGSFLWFKATTISHLPCTLDPASPFLLLDDGPASLGGGTTASVVYDTALQTLTNKTLTAPTVTSPALTTPTINGVTITNVPSMFFTSTQFVFTSTGLINSFTPTYGIIITGLEYSVPSGTPAGTGCATAPVINVGGIGATNLTMTNASTHGVETGLSISASGGSTVSAQIQTASAGCGTAWTNVTVSLQYRMQ